MGSHDGDFGGYDCDGPPKEGPPPAPTSLCLLPLDTLIPQVISYPAEIAGKGVELLDVSSRGRLLVRTRNYHGEPGPQSLRLLEIQWPSRSPTSSALVPARE